MLAMALAALAGVAWAQDLERIVALGDRPACAVSDLVSMAPALAAAFPEDEGLPERLAEALAGYEPGLPLTKRRAGYVAARALRVRSSIVFAVLPIERYAFRALVLDGVFGPASSGGDVMSGVELLGFLSRLAEVYGRPE